MIPDTAAAADLESPPAHQPHRVRRRIGAAEEAAVDCVAEEVPVALVYNGISHAVMMATPQDLADFALGFSLSEGILAHSGQLYDLETIVHADGLEVSMRIDQEAFLGLKARRRALTGRTGCGLCGVESLAAVACNLPPRVAPGAPVTVDALARAQDELPARQPLFQATGAGHAAAWCEPNGAIRLVREDVGRHNALDKLIGASRAPFGSGFLLLTSRASYEMVAKAARSGIATVAAVSAPTGAAVRLAQQTGITLIAFARGTRCNVYTHADRVI